MVVAVTQCRFLLLVSMLVLVIIVVFTGGGSSNTMAYFIAGVYAGVSNYCCIYRWWKQ